MPAQRIVAIDFDARIGERLRAAFAPPEFDFHWFSAGREALEALPELQPDVIICDVMLPDIDGRAVLDAVKGSPGLRDVPFLVLSGVRSQATIRATLDAGADAFLLKPFPVSQLLETIRKVLRDDSEPNAGFAIGDPQRVGANHDVASATGHAARDGASGPAGAFLVARDAPGRHRIGFEAQKAALEAPRAEPAALAATGREGLPSREEAGLAQRGAHEADGAAPIRLEGRFSSMEVAGARLRVITEAEKGRSVVVRTTVARDGKELRRIETNWDRALESAEDERSLKELIEAQHAGALQDVYRVLLSARPPEEAPPPADRLEGSASPGAADGAPTPTTPTDAVAAAPVKRAKAKPRARRRAHPQPPLSPDEVVLRHESEAGPVLPEPHTLHGPDDSGVAPVPKPIRRGSRAAWLAAFGLLIALGFLLRGPLGFAPDVQAPAPQLEALDTSVAAEAAPPAEIPATPEPQPTVETTEPAPVTRPKPAWMERLVRGRRDWAQALYEAGRYEEAKAALDEVFKLAPSDPEARRIAELIRSAEAAPSSHNDPAAPAPVAEAPSVAAPSVAAPVVPAPDLPAPIPADTAARALEAEPRQAREGPDGAQRQVLGRLEAPAAPTPEVTLGALVSLDDPGVVAPVVAHRPALAYPPLARQQRMEGTVKLEVLVDEAGIVTAARVVSGVPGKTALNEAAVQYARKWAFRPATKNGVAVQVWLPVRVAFELPR